MTMAATSQKGAVFVTYNGLLDPLGPSQILPYLERLNKTWPIQILSFERAHRLEDSAALASTAARLRDQKIGWVWTRYHKWPSLLATTWDLMTGAKLLRKMVREGNAGLVHARGYLPAAIALRANTSARFLFDIRGLQPEEYVDGGVWREGELKHRLAKRAERKFFERADAAVVLTEAIKPYVTQRFEDCGRTPPVTVIPCCVDLARFTFEESARERVRKALGVEPETVVFVYSGSVGTWYMPREMSDFVRTFRDQTHRRVRLLWMVNNDPERVVGVGREAGLSPGEMSAVTATPAEVPDYLSAADVGLALVRPSFSKRSSSPTKYAECLALGLPLVICRDVGDGAEIESAGGAVGLPYPARTTDLAAGAAKLEALLSLGREHFRKVARTLFDLEEVGVPRYEQIYRDLLG